MTHEEFVEAKANVKINDVHHARAIINETMHMHKENRMFKTAELLAVLREHYVKIGRELSKNP